MRSTRPTSRATSARRARSASTSRRVEYINSTGIALLVSLLGKARRDGRPVTAWGLTDHYREIFEITRLADFMEVVTDEHAARAAAGITSGEG